MNSSATVLEEGKLQNIVEGDGVAHVEDRVTPIQLGHGLIAAVAFARTFVVGAGRTTVPCRAIVECVTPGVVQGGLHAVAHLTGQADLQRIVDRIVDVLPHPQFAVIWIQTAGGVSYSRRIHLATKFSAKSVDGTS